MQKNVYVFAAILTIIASALFYHTKEAKAALCDVGGDVTIDVSCEINGAAAYNNLTIIGGAVVTTPGVGQKIDITAAGKVQIDAGSGIDVSGKGDNIAGKGVDGGVVGGGTVGSGGGGGGYGGAGGKGGTDTGVPGGAGGGTYGSNTNPFDLGSPGGLGGQETTNTGIGGGAVKIQAKQIILNGFIKANGANGSWLQPIFSSGASGGGSGGSIWILASNSFDFTGGNLEAWGGDGASEGGGAATGGGGGGGRISLQYKGPKIGIGSHDESFGLKGAGLDTGGTDGANGTFYEEENLAASCTLSASSVFQGEKPGISWTTKYAVSALINQGIGPVAPISGGSVSAAAPIAINTIYTMTVMGESGDTATCSALATVALAAVCVPGPCNGVCNSICTVAQDPDCACQSGNSCCAPGCTALNDSECGTPPVLSVPNLIPASSISEIAANFLKWALSIAGSLALLMLIIGGTMYMSSTGDEQRVSIAKKIVTWTVIGLVLILCSYAIIVILDSILI